MSTYQENLYHNVQTEMADWHTKNRETFLQNRAHALIEMLTRTNAGRNPATETVDPGRLASSPSQEPPYRYLDQYESNS
jgi:hypothetical protein